MPIVYRLATPKDVETLTRLIETSVRALSVGYYDERQIESALKYIFGVDTQLIDDGTYYAAISGAQIVGCGGWSRRKTLFGGDQMKAEEDNLLDPEHDAARIRAFFVHPQWARQGIGRRILEICEEAARAEGFDNMELVATMPGEPLYADMGFAINHRFDVHMPDGVMLPVASMVKCIGLA